MRDEVKLSISALTISSFGRETVELLELPQNRELKISLCSGKLTVKVENTIR